MVPVELAEDKHVTDFFSYIKFNETFPFFDIMRLQLHHMVYPFYPK